MKEYMDFWKGVGTGLLFGMLILGLWLGQPLQGETAASSQGIMALNANTNAEKQDLLYVFDANAQKLAVYGADLRGTFNLLDVRSVKYDIQLDFLKRQKPSVKEIRRKVK